MNEEVDQIWCSVGVTKNLGNYQSLKVDAGGRRTLKPGEDRDAAWTALWEEIEAEVEERLGEGGLAG